MRRHNSRLYKSGLEDKLKEICDKEGIEAEYEADTVAFVTPAQERKYHPDWRVATNCYIETKGIWDIDGRKKALLIKEQHPEIRILYVFSYSKAKLYKGSKTTYADFCEKNGLEWADFKDKEKWITWAKNIQCPKMGSIPDKTKKIKRTPLVQTND